MGTSKGYIAPTRPEWSKAKRAVSIYVKNRDPASRANVVAKYADAMLTKSSSSKSGVAFGSSFSAAVGDFLSFAWGVANNGLDKTLNQFGRDDLIGKPPGTIINQLLDAFTNHGSTIEDSLAAEALSSVFDALHVESPDDLAKLDLDSFLLELIIAFVNNNFDFRFYEKIGHGRTPEETRGILLDTHDYIDGTLRLNLTSADIGKIDLGNMEANKIVSDMLEDAFSICATVYGVDV